MLCIRVIISFDKYYVANEHYRSLEYTYRFEDLCSKLTSCFYCYVHFEDMVENGTTLASNGHGKAKYLEIYVRSNQRCLGQLIRSARVKWAPPG